MKRFLMGLLTGVVLIISHAAMAQAIITGTVKDATGEVLPGVSVSVKGTTTGTMTDENGNYSVSVAEGSTLVFSFIGYETVEAVTGNNMIIDITLKETTQSLDELVVVGYGTTTKKELTGSVTSLKTKDFNGGAFTDPMGLVQGKVAGLSVSQPNGADPNPPR